MKPKGIVKLSASNTNPFIKTNDLLCIQYWAYIGEACKNVYSDAAPLSPPAR